MATVQPLAMELVKDVLGAMPEVGCVKPSLTSLSST